MRDLLLVRGAPGSGKSTYIREHHLEPYTISSDAVRSLFSCPEDDPKTGEPHICQRLENRVWTFIEEMVELRMQTGQFIVIDAQNIKAQKWIKLAEKYRYRVYVKQMEATLDECLERNAKRPPLQRVPEHVIMASFWRIGESQLSNKFKPLTEDIANGDLPPADVNSYERIWLVGDIHGCYTPLKELFDKTDGFPETDLVVFVGDFCDRGIQNKETLELLCTQRSKKNVVFLEGNHEKWLTMWAEERDDEIKSNEFLNNTLPQIESVDRKLVRELSARFGQFFYFTYNGKRYLVTHAGIGYMPDHLLYVPAYTFIRGGDYENDVDRWWTEKNYGPDLIQVHGHRNFYCYEMDDPLLDGVSVNLNSAVEFGEPLRVMCITRDGHQYLKFENPVHRTGLIKFRKAEILEGKALATPEEATEILVDNLRKAKGINEKVLKNNISSFNFTRDVFNSDAWDDICMIARGLFIDTYAWKIVARGYIKFFNAFERSHNTKKWLFENIKYPCTAFRKYNGFLGLVSWNPQQQKLFIASKSTNDGDHSQLAESILRLYAPMEAIEAYLKENDCTMLFEICTKRDPHIISEPEGPVLLDIVDNTINFHCKPYEEVRAFGEKHGIKYKQLDAVINNWHELEPMLDTMWVMDPGHPVEGWVIQAADGYNFKLKCRYYSQWKRLRTIKEFIERGVEKINEASFADGSWMKALYLFMEGLHRHGQLEGKSIIDVRDMWLADDGIDYPYKPETKEETNGSEEERSNQS